MKQNKKQTHHSVIPGTSDQLIDTTEDMYMVVVLLLFQIAATKSSL